MPIFAGTLPLEEAVDDFNLQIRRYSADFKVAHPDVHIIFFAADEVYEEVCLPLSLEAGLHLEVVNSLIVCKPVSC